MYSYAFIIVKEGVCKDKGKDMSRIDICKENYKKLFNSEALTPTGNDPEFMAILQKYIFGEIFTVGELDIKVREMLTIVSLVTQQTLPQLKAHIHAGLNIGITPIELREVIYQCAPSIGFPKTLNALSVMNEVLEERGIALPLEITSTVDEQTRFEQGFAIQSKMYGSEVANMLQGLPHNIDKELSRYITEFYFGDFYTRKGLSIELRELLVISILVTTGHTEILRNHIQGNLRIGNSAETIAAAIIQCSPYVGFPNTIEALKVLKEIIAK